MTELLLVVVQMCTVHTVGSAHTNASAVLEHQRFCVKEVLSCMDKIGIISTSSFIHCAKNYKGRL